MECNTGSVINLVSLYKRFQGLQDKRKAKGKRYELATILMGIFLAKLCGEDKPSGIAEWARLREQWIITRMLGLKRERMSHHNTYRVFWRMGLMKQSLKIWLGSTSSNVGKLGIRWWLLWMAKWHGARLIRRRVMVSYLLAIYLPGEGVTLAQVAIESKQNEISAAPYLLVCINLRNKVVIGERCTPKGKFLSKLELQAAITFGL